MSIIQNYISQPGNLLSKKKIIRQFLKYSIVGVFNTAIGLGTIYIFYNIFKVNYIVSNIIGYLFGLTNSFIWNKKWTFRSKKNSSKEILPFFVIFVISYLMNLIAVIFTVEIIKINPNIAQLFGIAAYTATNFLANRRWTFAEHQ